MVGAAGRVAGRVQHQQPGLLGDGGAQLGRADPEPALQGGLQRHRRAAGQPHHIRVRHPVRRRDKHFVARVYHGLHQVVQRLLGARRDQDLLATVLELVVAPKFFDDRVLEFGRAINGRVARLALVNRVDCRLLDVIGRVEIRLTHAQADNVAPGSLELGGFHRHGDGGGGLDGCDALSGANWHEISLWIVPVTNSAALY